MAEAIDKVARFARHTYGTWRKQSEWAEPLPVENAEGSYFIDSKSNRYLDFSSQLVCSNLGHKNQAIIESIFRQAGKLLLAAPDLLRWRVAGSPWDGENTRWAGDCRRQARQHFGFARHADDHFNGGGHFRIPNASRQP
jgi:hypothetical protein